MTNDTLIKAIQLYKSGMTLDEVGASLGYCGNGIAYWFKKTKVPIRHKGSRGQEVNIDDLIKDYRAGASSYKLNKKYKLSSNTIISWLRKHNEPIRPPGRTPKRRKEG